MKYEAVVQEYLPVNSHPTDYPICKEGLHFLLEVTDDLEIPFIYVYEIVYSKLCEILWKREKYIHQNYSFNGWLSSIKSHAATAIQWCFDAKRIAEESIDQAFEGRH